MLPQRTATNAGLRHFLARSHGYSSTMPVMTASIVANCNMKKKMLSVITWESTFHKVIVTISAPNKLSTISKQLTASREMVNN